MRYKLLAEKPGPSSWVKLAQPVFFIGSINDSPLGVPPTLPCKTILTSPKKRYFVKASPRSAAHHPASSKNTTSCLHADHSFNNLCLAPAHCCWGLHLASPAPHPLALNSHWPNGPCTAPYKPESSTTWISPLLQKASLEYPPWSTSTPFLGAKVCRLKKRAKMPNT